jgi:hypothetical protein
MREKGVQNVHYLSAYCVSVFEGRQHGNMRRHTFSRRGVVPVAEFLYEGFRLGDEDHKGGSFLRVHTRIALFLALQVTLRAPVTIATLSVRAKRRWPSSSGLSIGAFSR